MTWNSSPLRLNPPSRASNPLRVPNNAQPSARFRCGGAPHLFRPQSRLPQMIGQMIGTTQQDGETVAQRFLQKVFLRHGSVLLQPVSRRETCKPLKQSGVNFSPGPPNRLDRRNSGLRLIGIGNERDIKLRMDGEPEWLEPRVPCVRVMSDRRRLSTRVPFSVGCCCRKYTAVLLKPRRAKCLCPRAPTTTRSRLSAVRRAVRNC